MPTTPKLCSTVSCIEGRPSAGGELGRGSRLEIRCLIWVSSEPDGKAFYVPLVRLHIRNAAARPVVLSQKSSDVVLLIDVFDLDTPQKRRHLLAYLLPTGEETKGNEADSPDLNVAIRAVICGRKPHLVGTHMFAVGGAHQWQVTEPLDLIALDTVQKQIDTLNPGTL
jgi:hypothetical protein